MIHQLQIGASRPAFQVSTSLNEAVAARRMKERKWYIVRTASILFLVSLVLISIVVWRRDNLQLGIALAGVRGPAAMLQAQVDSFGVLPAGLPREAWRPVPYYADDADRFYAANTTNPVIIGGSHPVNLLLRPDGRCVIIWQGGKLRVEWLTNSEFDRLMVKQHDDVRAFLRERRSRPPELP